MKNNYLDYAYIEDSIDLFVCPRKVITDEETIRTLFNEISDFRDELMALFPDILVPGNKTKSATKK